MEKLRRILEFDIQDMDAREAYVRMVGQQRE
jgi:hypothetical protein